MYFGAQPNSITTKNNQRLDIDPNWEKQPMLLYWLSLWNQILDEGTLPRSWRNSKIIMIHKTGKPENNPRSYRPISKIPTSQKCLHKFLTQRLLRYITDNNIIAQEQIGYLKREETGAQIIALQEIIGRRKRNHMNTYAIFMDIQKAFDSVPHNKLLQRLEDDFGIKEKTPLYNYIQQLYLNTTIQVVHNGVESTERRLTCGLRQGCPLSPVLFLMYINRMIKYIRKHPIQVPFTNDSSTNDLEEMPPSLWFADDVVILCSSIDECKTILREVIQIMAIDGFDIGEDKCGVLPFYDAPKDNNNEDIRIEDKRIKYVENYTYLGMVINQTNDIYDTIRTRTSRFRITTLQIYPSLLNKHMTVSDKRILILSYYYTRIIYPPAAWFVGLQGDLSGKPIQDIDKNVQKMCTTAMFGAKGIGGTTAMREMAVKPPSDMITLQFFN